jgi:hypothetical protein
MAHALADGLLVFLAPDIENGQRSFANELRRHAYASAPNVFRLLDFEDDSAFLEPSAFADAARDASSNSTLASVYAGAIDPRRRPRKFTVEADEHGRVFLPRLGFLVGLKPTEAINVVRDTSSVGYSALGAQAVQLTDWRVCDPQPFLLPYPIPALERAGDAGDSLVGVEDAAQRHRNTLVAAFQRIRDDWPALAAAISRVTRYIVLFDDPAKNSFAKTSAHGVAFLNVALGRSESFFVEDLTHQCGHILFTAAWEGAEPFLSTAPNAHIGELTGQGDHRTLEVALHGMVTQTLMVSALDCLLSSGSDEIINEATGRLLFALMRVGLDLRNLSALPVYTDHGIALMRELLTCYATAAKQYGPELLATDFFEQPYNFDYGVYRSRNPNRLSGIL